MYIYTALASPFEWLAARNIKNRDSGGVSPPRLAIEVLLVLLHGGDLVPPLQYMVEVRHQVLVLFKSW